LAQQRDLDWYNWDLLSVCCVGYIDPAWEPSVAVGVGRNMLIKPSSAAHHEHYSDLLDDFYVSNTIKQLSALKQLITNSTIMSSASHPSTTIDPTPGGMALSQGAKIGIGVLGAFAVFLAVVAATILLRSFSRTRMAKTCGFDDKIPSSVAGATDLQSKNESSTP
jgi:hypothetical protein